MTAALLCAAAALALWPAGSGAPGRVVARRRPAGARVRPFLSSPPAAGAMAALTGAVLSTPLVAALAGCCAALAARSLLRHRRAATELDGLLGLAEALGVLAAELDAGRPLLAAARTAAQARPDGDAAAGLVGVLDPDVDPESGPAELERVRAAIRLSVRTGCPLAAVVRALEDDLRARHRHVQDLRTATAGPRASAVVLAGLPVLGLLMGSGIGARPWAVLTTTALGQVLLEGGVALEAAGIAWTGRLSARAAGEPASGRAR